MANIIIKLQGVDPTANIKPSLRSSNEKSNLPKFLKYLGETVGAYEPKALVQILNNDAIGASATVTVSFASMTDGDTIQIGAMTLTAKSSGATGAQFNIGASNTAAGLNLAGAINSNSSGLLSGNNAAGVVTVASKIAGPLGNTIPIIITQTSPSGMVASATSLSGGADDTASVQDYRSF